MKKLVTFSLFALMAFALIGCDTTQSKSSSSKESNSHSGHHH